MKCVLIALLVCVFCSASVAATKTNDIPLGNTADGKLKSEDNRCQECHGADGNGQGLNNGSAGQFAKLAGQYPLYITKQIREFRTGTRKHDLMQIMSKSIDDQDAADIAAYFSNQKKMQGDGGNNNELGKQLFTLGDTTRNILPCISCHGSNGKGIDANQQTVPVIGGQEWHYLQKQLQDWRSGERHNSEGNAMNIIAKQLTDLELTALANYIAAL